MPSIGSEWDIFHVAGSAEVSCSLIASSIPTSEKKASTSFIRLFQSPITMLVSLDMCIFDCLLQIHPEFMSGAALYTLE